MLDPRDHLPRGVLAPADARLQIDGGAPWGPGLPPWPRIPIDTPATYPPESPDALAAISAELRRLALLVYEVDTTVARCRAETYYKEIKFPPHLERFSPLSNGAYKRLRFDCLAKPEAVDQAVASIMAEITPRGGLYELS